MGAKPIQMSDQRAQGGNDSVSRRLLAAETGDPDASPNTEALKERHVVQSPGL